MFVHVSLTVHYIAMDYVTCYVVLILEEAGLHSSPGNHKDLEIPRAENLSPVATLAGSGGRTMTVGDIGLSSRGDAWIPDVKARLEIASR